MPLTIYTFGYWGWGNATRQLVKSVDAVERHRGYRQPLFVDIRIHRAVRAKGFAGDAFEQTVGKSRHRWMPELGNLSVMPAYRAARIRIKNPAAAADLLQLAKDNARAKRHIIFFCSCEFPRWCHRHTVAGLLLRAARRQKLPLTVTEWPGGEPSTRAQTLPGVDEIMPKSPRLPLISTRPLWRYAGLPTGTLVRLHAARDAPVLPVGPARFAPNGWYLPVLLTRHASFLKPMAKSVNAYRREIGLSAVRLK